jgi:hypothetical protein
MQTPPEATPKRRQPRRDRLLGARADLTALEESVDLPLGLGLGQPVLGHDLRHEIGLALDRSDVLLGELLHFEQISFITALF